MLGIFRAILFKTPATVGLIQAFIIVPTFNALVYGNGQVKRKIRDGKEGERNLPTSRMNHK